MGILLYQEKSPFWGATRIAVACFATLPEIADAGRMASRAFGCATSVLLTDLLLLSRP